MTGSIETETGDGRTYLCIDLKTFYASVECADRALDPPRPTWWSPTPRAGPSTICLAVTPALKALGVRNRCRMFEIPAEILADTIVARPRMRHYMEVSAPDLRDLPHLREPPGHLPLLNRRVLHRRHPLPGPVRHRRRGLRPPPHGRREAPDGHPRHGGHRTKPLPRQGGARRHRQARGERHRHPGRGGLPARHLAPPPHHRHLGHRAGHRATARRLRRPRPHGRRGPRRGGALPRVRGERRVPHRPRLRGGARDHRRDPGPTAPPRPRT